MDIIEKTITTQYTLERLNQDNLHHLAHLYSVVHHTMAVPGYISDKYDTSYTGVKYVGFMAYTKNGEPIAFNGVIPCYVQYNGQTVLAAQAADYMTHPAHRNKGLLLTLSEMTFELCRLLGINLLFGFPNQHSYHTVVNKLEWKQVGTMTCFQIPVKGFQIAAFAKHIKPFKRWHDLRKQAILKKWSATISGVANSVICDGFAGIERSEQYFAYKEYCKASVISIDEVKVWVKLKNALMLGDVDGLTDNNFGVVIEQLKMIAREIGVSQIQFHCCPDTSLFRLFAKHYQPVPSYPVLYKDFGSLNPPGKLRFTFADIDIF